MYKVVYTVFVTQIQNKHPLAECFRQCIRCNDKRTSGTPFIPTTLLPQLWHSTFQVSCEKQKFHWCHTYPHPWPPSSRHLSVPRIKCLKGHQFESTAETKKKTLQQVALIYSKSYMEYRVSYFEEGKMVKKIYLVHNVLLSQSQNSWRDLTHFQQLNF
jgi:hypothetical protein